MRVRAALTLGLVATASGQYLRPQRHQIDVPLGTAVSSSESRDSPDLPPNRATGTAASLSRGDSTQTDVVVIGTTVVKTTETTVTEGVAGDSPTSSPLPAATSSTPAEVNTSTSPAPVDNAYSTATFRYAQPESTHSPQEDNDTSSATTSSLAPPEFTYSPPTDNATSMTPSSSSPMSNPPTATCSEPASPDSTLPDSMNRAPTPVGPESRTLNPFSTISNVAPMLVGPGSRPLTPITSSCGSSTSANSVLLGAGSTPATVETSTAEACTSTVMPTSRSFVSTGRSMPWPSTYTHWPRSSGGLPPYPANETVACKPTETDIPNATTTPVHDLPPQYCNGATLNVLNASLDWWYTSTFTYIASTISATINNNSTGWTVKAASTSFNVTSAVETPSCQYTVTVTSDWYHTYSILNGTCYKTPAPTAASTSILSITAYKPLNQTAGNGTLPTDIVTNPPVPSATVPAVNNATTTSAGAFAAGTPFVYFSQYEVVRKQNSTNNHGHYICAEATTTHNLTEPFSFEFMGVQNFEQGLLIGANVTGDVNSILPTVVGQETATPGSWVAAPTVVMVLQKVLAVQGAILPFAASASLVTITPTLPDGFATQTAGRSLSEVGVTIKVQSSQPVLLLPTGGSSSSGSGNSGSSNSGSGYSGSGRTGSGSSGSDNKNGGGIGGAVGSAVVSAVNSPTNALQVLTQAQAEAGNPTAGAIVAGLGGSSNQGGGGGSPAGSGGSGDSGSNSGSNGNSGSSGSNQGGVAAAPVPVITVGRSTVTAQPTPAAIVVNGQTAVPGGAPITVSGHTISAASGGSAVVVDGTTVPIAAGGFAQSTVFNVGGIQITAAPGAVFVVGSQTLTAGGAAITQDGTTLSLLPGGTALVVNGVTQRVGSQQTPGAAANIPLLTVGSKTFTANAATQFSLAPGATLTPGGQVFVAGSTISLASGATAVIINGNTHSLDSPAINPAPLLSIGSTVYQANAGSTYDVKGHMLQPGGVVTVDGTTISMLPGASAVVINGQTQRLSSPGITAGPQLTVGGAVFTAEGGSTFNVNGEVLTPGGAITVFGTYVSMLPGGTAVVVNGVTSTLAGVGSPTAPNGNLATITAPPVLTVNGQAYAPNGGSSYLINGRTLQPGSSIVITRSDGVVETLSLDSAASELYSVVRGTTYTSVIGVIGAMATGAPVLTIDGRTYTAVAYDTGSGPEYVVNGQTLTRGGSIVNTATDGSKETIALDAAGTVLKTISGGHTAFSTITGAYGVMPTAAPLITVDGQVFTAINNGATYVIGGKTVTPGELETVTLNGHTYLVSLYPQATLLEIETVGTDGKTSTVFETLFPSQMTRSTITNTVMGTPSAGATLTATAASKTAGGSSSGTAGHSSGSMLSVQLGGLCIAASSFVLALWL